MTRRHDFTRQYARAAAVAALCLAVFAALAPGLSYALGARQSGPALVICSSAGPVSQAPPSPDDGAAMRMPHCPFCLQTTDRGAPPPQPLPYHLMVQGGSQVSVVWQAFFYDLNSPWMPPPRGPPCA